jgi:hypothetical protein
MNLRQILTPPAILIGLLYIGCDRPSAIRVYTAPQDPAAGTPESAPSPGQPSQGQVSRAQKARPRLAWSLPQGWQEAAASQVNAAQFTAKTSGGEVGISATPLPNLQGKESLVVNMWREQLGQPPLDPAQLSSALSPIEVAGASGQLFEVAGSREGTPQRMITAFLHQADASWFFKLSGPESAVNEQKPVFLEFLKSVRIGGPESAAPSQP